VARPGALGASFLFFLTALRQVHGAFHHSLGLTRLGEDLVQLAGSLAMLGSIHALGSNHLYHHRRCFRFSHEEARPARLSWWLAILSGPSFLWRCHRSGWSLAKPRVRCWIAAELALNALWIALVFGALDIGALRYHVMAMTAGNSLTAFFCVWTVHRGCFDGVPAARTLRGAWKNLLSANMFLHEEHHRFPAVPTCHLAALAERLDRAASRRPLRLLSGGEKRRQATAAVRVRPTAPASVQWPGENGLSLATALSMRSGPSRRLRVILPG
jgi:hypothetical protein